MSDQNLPSISVIEKPSKHLSVSDWHRNVTDIRLYGENQRQNAHVFRNGTRQARNEAVIASNWNKHRSEVLLNDRMAEVQQWLETLQFTRQVLDNEMLLLTEEKTTAELEIEAYYRALNVVSECLLLRDRRSIADLTYDDPYQQLQSELKLLDSSKVELTNKCLDSSDLLMKGRDISTKIFDNVADKITAVEIDRNNLTLNKESPLISNKPDVLRIPQGIVAHEAWLQSAQDTQTIADCHTETSTKLREAMRLLREKVKMDYLCQVEATNFALRKRIYDANRLKNELQWQRKNTLEEMSKVQKEIEELRACVDEHDALLKCSETRQENRNMRPAEELVHDNPHDGLIEEIISLRQTLRDIKDKLDNALRTYNQLENLVVKLDSELAKKELCIQMEMRTLDARSNLIQHQPATSIDQDVTLVKMENQIPPNPMC